MIFVIDRRAEAKKFPMLNAPQGRAKMGDVATKLRYVGIKDRRKVIRRLKMLAN